MLGQPLSRYTLFQPCGVEIGLHPFELWLRAQCVDRAAARLRLLLPFNLPYLSKQLLQHLDLPQQQIRGDDVLSLGH
jgi:hypothetical protein